VIKLGFKWFHETYFFTDTDSMGCFIIFSNTNMESDREKYYKSNSNTFIDIILKSNTDTYIHISSFSEYEYG
jgi:hypothetical protein